VQGLSDRCFFLREAKQILCQLQHKSCLFFLLISIAKLVGWFFADLVTGWTVQACG